MKGRKEKDRVKEIRPVKKTLKQPQQHKQSQACTERVQHLYFKRDWQTNEANGRPTL